MLINLDYETINLARKYRSSALNHFGQARSVLTAVAEAADNTIVHDPTDYVAPHYSVSTAIWGKPVHDDYLAYVEPFYFLDGSYYIGGDSS